MNEARKSRKRKQQGTSPVWQNHHQQCSASGSCSLCLLADVPCTDLNKDRDSCASLKLSLTIAHLHRSYHTSLPGMHCVLSAGQPLGLQHNRQQLPVLNGRRALCIVRQEQLPDTKVIAGGPVLCLRIPVVELSYQCHCLQPGMCWCFRLPPVDHVERWYQLQL